MLDDFLSFPYDRLINIWWFPSFPYLKIQKFGVSLTWKWKKLGNLPNSYFMFLIDMKFISKLLQMFIMESLSFSILSSTKLFWKYVLELQQKEKRNKKQKTWYIGHTFSKFFIFESHIDKYNIFPGWSHIFLYFWSILVIIRRATGPDFDKNFEVPEII